MTAIEIPPGASDGRYLSELLHELDKLDIAISVGPRGGLRMTGPADAIGIIADCLTMTGQRWTISAA